MIFLVMLPFSDQPNFTHKLFKVLEINLEMKNDFRHGNSWPRRIGVFSFRDHRFYTSLWASLHHHVPMLFVFHHVKCHFIFDHVPPNVIDLLLPNPCSLGPIQVLRNADGGGGGVSDFLEKSVTKV